MSAGGASWGAAGSLDEGLNSFTLSGTTAGGTQPFWRAYWTVTPVANTRVTINTFGSTYTIAGSADTQIYVYQGGTSEGTATQVAFNDDASTELGAPTGTRFLSRVIADLTAGQTYHVVVGTFHSSADTITVYGVNAHYAATPVSPTTHSAEPRVSAPVLNGFAPFTPHVWNPTVGWYFCLPDNSDGRAAFAQRVKSDKTLEVGTPATYGGASTGSESSGLLYTGTVMLQLFFDGYLSSYVMTTAGAVTWSAERRLTSGAANINEINAIAFDGLTGTVYVYYLGASWSLGGTRVKSMSLDPTTGALGALTDVGAYGGGTADSSPGGTFRNIPGDAGRVMTRTGNAQGQQGFVRFSVDPGTEQGTVTTPVTGSTLGFPSPMSRLSGFQSWGLPLLATQSGLVVERWSYSDYAMTATGSYLIGDLVPVACSGINWSLSPVYDDTVVNAVGTVLDSGFNPIGYLVVFDVTSAVNPIEWHYVPAPSGGSVTGEAILGPDGPLAGDADVIYVVVTENSALNGSGTNTGFVERWSITPPVPVNNAHCGEKVAKYTVTANSALPYTVSPNGPSDDVHFGKFAVPASGTVSFMASLASDNSQDFYVQPQARFLSWNGTTFTTLSYANMGAVVHLTGNATWTTITRIIDAPPGATHWALDFAVQGDSAGTVVPTIGTVLYLDCVYVVENGMDLASEPYLDGDQVGTSRGDGFWEGTPHDATSIWGAPAPPVDTNPPPTDDGGDTGGTSSDPTPNDEDPTGGDQPPPPPEAPPVVCAAADLVTRRHPNNSFCPDCLDGDVQLGDHRFNTVDEFGTFWSITDVDGWWNLPDPDIPDITRGIDDGSYETRGRYSARLFTVTGSFWPSSPHEVRSSRDRLIRAINLCHYGAWFATHELDATRASLVWLSGRPSIATVSDNGRTDFSIGLKAPDPVKYGLFERILPGWNGQALKSSTSTADFGRVYDRAYEWSYPTVPSGGVLADSTTVTNDGNVRVSPIINVFGPTLGPIDIHNESTGQVMRVRLNLGADDVLVLDCLNRTVTLNGVPNRRFYLDTITDWIYLDPGANRFTYSEETGSSSSFITVQWRSGWIG